MENKILIAGFGGQGILLLGQMLGDAATRAGLQATYYPSYGPEQRGGTASCSVIISDDEIGSPVFQKIDTLIVMNEPSLVKFGSRINPGGSVFINSSMVNTPSDLEEINVYHLPATDIAKRIGSEKASNLVMLGAFNGVTGILPDDLVCHTIETKLAKKKELLDLNLLAYQKGVTEIKK